MTSIMIVQSLQVHGVWSDWTDLLVCIVDPGPVCALQLQSHVLLLGGDQLLVARLHELRRLLVLDGRQASANK